MGNLYGLIGHPIGHSLSSDMHNVAFQKHGIVAHYESFDIQPPDLQKAIEGMKAIGIAGFNVTVPYKVSVIQYLDEIDEEAERLGAVNTVINRDGRLFGTNTDGRGYLHALMNKVGQDLSDKSVLVIGAGGAARGVAITLDHHGVHRIDIANRTMAKANELIRDGVSHTTSKQPLTLEKAMRQLGNYDVIINTTPVGMFPNVDEMPMYLNELKRGTLLSDLIYNPIRTKWLQEGEKRGATVLDGVGMFVGQGALAFELWTGISPDREQMRRTVLKLLGER